MIDRRRCREFLVMITLMIAIAGTGRPLAEVAVVAQSPIPIQAEAFPAKMTATIDFPRGITVSGLLDVRQLTPDQDWRHRVCSTGSVVTRPCIL